jgi:site-specific DNA recombinase
MPEARLISPITRQAMAKSRVAAYCRVSSNSADQQNSYATQMRVYTSMIQKRKDWELVEIFADEGLSGMKADNRTEFQRMIHMCELHQIDLIITKSVSRFARNAKESLVYVRKLKLLGIGVQFEKEGIFTLALGDEMLLNTFSAIAQEESKAISQNQRLSIVKRMEGGEYVDSNAPYGFRLIEKELTSI